mmetsp:Transcript_1435/g.4874  ORF Transcript_1435/g.4874 Transcript_1435/m.4874 type:complete len:224 (+) Transcript_1435:751-1422(+)
MLLGIPHHVQETREHPAVVDLLVKRVVVHAANAEKQDIVLVLLVEPDLRRVELRPHQDDVDLVAALRRHLLEGVLLQQLIVGWVHPGRPDGAVWANLDLLVAIRVRVVDQVGDGSEAARVHLVVHALDRDARRVGQALDLGLLQGPLRGVSVGVALAALALVQPPLYAGRAAGCLWSGRGSRLGAPSEARCPDSGSGSGSGGSRPGSGSGRGNGGGRRPPRRR